MNLSATENQPVTGSFRMKLSLKIPQLVQINEVYELTEVTEIAFTHRQPDYCMFSEQMPVDLY